MNVDGLVHGDRSTMLLNSVEICRVCLEELGKGLQAAPPRATLSSHSSKLDNTREEPMSVDVLELPLYLSMGLVVSVVRRRPMI